MNLLYLAIPLVMDHHLVVAGSTERNYRAPSAECQFGGCAVSGCLPPQQSFRSCASASGAEAVCLACFLPTIAGRCYEGVGGPRHRRSQVDSSQQTQAIKACRAGFT